MRTHLVLQSSPAARRAVARTAASLAAVTGLLLGGATAAGAMTHTASAPTVHTKAAKPILVPIEKNAFMPPALTVTLGQAVTWTNDDDVPHTVTTTSAPTQFDSGAFDKGKSFTYTFRQAGVYKYYCAVHPDMTGTITVVDGAAAAPTSGDDPISGAMNPFMAHMQSAHFSRGVGAQVQDIAELDTWLKTHEALFRMMLDPEVGPSSTLGKAPVTSTFMQHMDAAHWNRSPMGQAQDISNFDTWNSSHLAMIRMMLDPFVGKDSGLGTAPGTGVLMQHMDAAHWNKSVNGQATDIVDDTPTWISSHQAMFQMMLTSLAAGRAHH